MILYGTYYSPFARRVGTALLSRNFEFTHDPLNGYEAPERASELNPVGRIPVLDIGEGVRLIDSWAILDWIDGAVPESQKLLPSSPLERVEQLRLASLSTAVCEIATARNSTSSDPSGRSKLRMERLERQFRDGMAALEASASKDIDLRLPLLGTISMVVAFDYAQLLEMDREWLGRLPHLNELSKRAGEQTAFRNTLPVSNVDD
jgi:glutathione S-transferase